MRVLRYLIVLAVCSTNAMASEPQSSVLSIAKTRFCQPAQVKVLGFLHPSHHGAWIGDSPVIGGPGLAIDSIQSGASRNEELLSYVSRPEEYLNNSFKAVFIGAITCNRNGIPVLTLHEVEQISISPVREPE